ncbi:HAD hydrolase-like protein [bacterium]|nr:HAD hydrolase-like protein [bacterium]
MQEKPVLIFDFDGTIADTFTPTMEILRVEYEKWGDYFHRRHTINQLRSLTIWQIIHTIPGGWWKFVYLLMRAKKHIHAHAHQIKAYPGIVYTLNTLYDQGYQMYIVTSNDVPSVQNFLRQYDLDTVFADIMPTKGLWRKAKTLKKLCRRYQIPIKSTLYFGDEIRDIQACQQIGMPVVSLTYGYNSQIGLERFKPDYLVKKPTQILTLLQNYPQKHQS